ncbi:ABC transporter ATP-binding protein [Amycolatopsis sp. NPDC059657]|uniref:ABC transporter ATP-binding protein n=1 Tax=Amycolatopsis sp. NPDC059657 TaxID=3346899 RepID=UPI00366EE73E
MIRRLIAVLGPEQSRDLRRAVVCLAVAAALQGAAFAFLLPILRGGGWPWLVGAGVVLAVCAVFYYRGVVAGRRAGYTLSTVLHHRIGDHVVTLPLGWFTPARVGSLGRVATQNVMSVMGVPAHLLEPLIGAVVTPVAAMAALSLLDWRLGTAALATVPFVVTACWWTTRLVRATDHAADAAAADAAGRVVEFAQHQPVLRAFGRGSHGLRLLDEALVRQRKSARRMLRTALPGLAGFVVTVQAAFTALLLTGTFLALGGRIEPTVLVVALLLAVRFTEPMLTAAELGAALRMAGNSLERIERVLTEPRLPEPERSPPLGPPSIEFDGVRFGYDRQRVLDGVSFVVPMHTTTALVGPSGAGKSTLLRLAARFADVEDGSVRIGGIDVRDLRDEDLLSQLSLVSQDVYLFEGTVADNIRFGRPEATDTEVRDAARRAGVADLLTRNGVGEGGARLSGGERQRVSIARALLKDAPIVLLDEPMAALDGTNEQVVTRALDELRAHRTLLMVTHRLSTVRTADQIVVLDGGRVTERGDHGSLLALGGRYAGFDALRSGARGWRIAAAGKIDGGN